MSSFDNGWSDGVVARLSKPATMSRATPTTILVPRFKFNFIAEYPLPLALPNPMEAPLIYIYRVFPAGKSCMAGPSQRVGTWSDSPRRLYTEELAAPTEVSPGASGATGSVG